MVGLVIALLRVIAVYLFAVRIVPTVTSIYLFTTYSYEADFKPESSQVLLFFIEFAFALVLFLLLWFAAPKLSRLITDNKQSDVEIHMTEETVIQSGLTLGGIFLIVSHLPKLLGTLLNYFLMTNLTREFSSRVGFIESIAVSILTILLGVYLVSGHKAIYNTIKKLRG